MSEVFSASFEALASRRELNMPERS